MATVENKVIMYDDACPMCRAYTAMFVRCGILDREGRTGFARAKISDLARIDTNRARHEIPLLDTITGETIYGLDAMILLIESHLPFLKPIFHIPGLRPLLRVPYKLISYNRRVIVGCSPKPLGENGFDPQPYFSLFWRSIHLVLCGCIWLTLTASVAVRTPTIQWGLVVFVLLQSLFFVFFLWKRPQGCNGWDRAGSLATNVLLFGFLLFVLTAFIYTNPFLYWASFAIAVAITVFDVRRRL